MSQATSATATSLSSLAEVAPHKHEPPSPSALASASAPASPSPLSSLHADVYGLYSFLYCLSQHDYSERRHVLSRLTSVLHSLYPSAEVKSIGSCATDLFLPDSDMDLLVRHPARLPPLTISDLHAMGGALQPLCTSLQIISTASVPLIKLTADTVTVDITLNVDTGHHSTRLVQSYIDYYPVLRPLTLVIKQLLKARALNDLYSGGLPSYTLILMVVSMLQSDEQGRLDTVVLEGQAERAATDEKRAEEAPHTTSPLSLAADASAAHSPTLPPDLGVYLLTFLRLYGCTFDYASLGISVRLPGHYFLKAQRQWLHAHNPQLLCVENPLDPTIDLGFKVFNIAEIVACFRDAYQQLTHNQPLAIRAAGRNRAESLDEAPIGDAAQQQEREEVKEFQSEPPHSTPITASGDVALRSPSPQQLPAVSFDHLRTTSAPAHPLQFSSTSSFLSTSTPPSASSSASSQQTPSRASTTSPASPSLKHPSAVLTNGFHYSAAPHNPQPQSALFYPPALYAPPAAGPPPPQPHAAAPSGGVCMAPCCFQPSHVLVADRQGNLMYIPASFASHLQQQANAAQMALPNGSHYALYAQPTTNGFAHGPQHQQQSQHSAPYAPPSSPPSTSASGSYTAPPPSHYQPGPPHTSHGGGGGSKSQLNGHSGVQSPQSQSPQPSSASKQRGRAKGGGGSSGGGGKGKRAVLNGAAVNGHTT